MRTDDVHKQTWTKTLMTNMTDHKKTKTEEQLRHIAMINNMAEDDEKQTDKTWATKTHT